MSYRETLLMEIGDVLFHDAAGKDVKCEDGRLFVYRWGDWHEVSVRINPRTLGLPATPASLDYAIGVLVKQGLDVETIANRCGVTVLEVADSLRRFMFTATEEVEL